jgi:cytidylate kinase
MALPTVITIARELGSGGSYIGMQVARRLGYVYIDRQILQQAATELGLEENELAGREECVQSFWDKLISVFAIGVPDNVYTPPPRWVSDGKLAECEQRLIRELAAKGACVVLGRGAFHFLRGKARLLNVFIHAPLSFRVQRLIHVYGAPGELEAARMIDHSDQERTRYIRSWTGLDRFDARNYHLCIDTGAFDFAAAEELVVSLAKNLREEGDWPWVDQKAIKN